MAELQHQVVIERPVSAVFEYITDLDNFEKWQTHITGVERVSQAQMAVGTTWKVWGQAMGRALAIDVEVTALEPDRLLALRTSGGPLEGESTLLFEPVEGGTLVTLTGQARLSGMYQLFEPLLAEQAQGKWEADLAKLEECLEAEEQRRNAAS